MDIYSKPGTKVVFTGEGGYDADREFAFSYMKIGDVLTVKSIDVGNWASLVEFEEILNVKFNTAMFEEKKEAAKKAFWEHQEEFAQKMQEISEKYEADCNEYWDKLSYEDKMKAFYSVSKRIYQADVKDQGSYRHALYQVFGFDVDAYSIGMECGYMDIHNYIQEGIATHKEYAERTKNEHMSEDL
jgi:hypothetical protein